MLPRLPPSSSSAAPPLSTYASARTEANTANTQQRAETESPLATSEQSNNSNKRTRRSTSASSLQLQMKREKLSSSNLETATREASSQLEFEGNESKNKGKEALLHPHSALQRQFIKSRSSPLNAPQAQQSKSPEECPSSNVSEGLRYSSRHVDVSEVIQEDQLSNPTQVTYEVTHTADDGNTAYGVAELKNGPEGPVLRLDLAPEVVDDAMRSLTPGLMNHLDEMFANRIRIDLSAFNKARNLEAEFYHLFHHPGISEISASENKIFADVTDVEMSSTMCKILSKGSTAALGTEALATCIAIAARGKNSAGEIVLGLSHYSETHEETGEYLPPKAALDHLLDQMTGNGAKKESINFYLAGGQLAPSGTQSNTLNLESELLSLSKEFNIVAVRLHPTLVECNASGEKISRHTNNDHDSSINAVITAEGMFYSHGRLYKPRI